MKSSLLVVVVAIVFCCATNADSPVSRDEISSDRAYELAALYRGRYISLCGAAGDPIRHSKYWEVPIVIGVGAQPAGSIRVDRQTGLVSYPGHPAVTPKQLDAWFNSLGKRTHKP
jgi:hypothetical protein